jgi:predicted phosphate transport protein (TIGR00153 family)
MSWFRNPLKPRKDHIIERLISQAEACVAGLEGLVKYVAAPSPEVAQIVREAEERGDEERRLLIDELNRTFVTPLDREDIFALSRAIDDVLDYAYSTVDELALFQIQPNQYVAEMAQLLHEAGKEIHRAMQRILEHRAVANEHAIRAKQLENRVEKTYRQAIAALFQGKVQTVEGVLDILKLREVYRHISNAADRADGAANIIADLNMKVM